MEGLAQCERRVVGIENSGNTCYCNAVLQVLFSARQFCLWFLHNDANRRFSPDLRSRFRGRLCAAWVKLLRQVYGQLAAARSPPRLNCSSLLSILRAEHPEFAINRQNDAHEFLRTFLDGLSADCNRISRPARRIQLEDRPGEQLQRGSDRFWKASLADEQSVVTDLFAGQHATIITCKTCKNVRHRFDNFLDLPVEFSQQEARGAETLEKMIVKSYSGAGVSLSVFPSCCCSI